MNTREVWLKIMHYQDYDRMPVMCWYHKLWPETRDRWIKEGLPKDLLPQSTLSEFGEDESKFGPQVEEFFKYFNIVPHRYIIKGLNLYLYPGFEKEIIEETQE